MAVVTDTRVLRSAPDGEAMSVLAKSGTRVQILDDKSHNPPWIKVALLDSPGAPQGWLSAGAVDPNANSVDGPLDKLVFGLECAWQAEAFGVTAHYLLAISELRSRVTNAVNANGDHGPFALSPFEWRFFNALPELDLGLDDTAIDSWRAQCAVFAAMVGRQQDKLSQLLSGQPTMSELYLAQMVGTKAAFAALRDQTRSLAEVLANLPDADLQSDGIERARIDARYGIVLAGSNIKAAISSLDDALQKALDSTHPILTEVGGQILGSPSDEIPTVKTDIPPDRGAVVSPAGRVLSFRPNLRSCRFAPVSWSCRFAPVSRSCRFAPVSWPCRFASDSGSCRFASDSGSCRFGTGLEPSGFGQAIQVCKCEGLDSILPESRQRLSVSG